MKILFPYKTTVLEDVKGIDEGMIIISRDGKYVINTNGKELFIWNAETGLIEKKKKMDFRLPFSSYIDAVKRVLVLFHKKNIYLYSLPDLRLIKDIKNAHEDHIYIAKISPDKKQILTASKKEIKIWSLDGLIEYKITNLKMEWGYMTPAFDPEELIIAYKQKNNIILHDINTGKISRIEPCKADFDPGPGEPIIISRKHNIMITACETSVNIYSILPPLCLMKILHYQPLTAIRYDAQIDKISICKSEQINFILDPATLKLRPLCILDNPDNGAYDAAWVVKNKLRLVGWTGRIESLMLLEYQVEQIM